MRARLCAMALTTPPASWRGPRLIDDETVAKMGHPNLDVGNPAEDGAPKLDVGHQPSKFSGWGVFRE